MTVLNIEWQHLNVDKDGESSTCERCGDTGRSVADVVEALERECASKGVTIRYRETRLATAEIARSNSILLNGEPIEAILPRARASQSHCSSCSDLVGAQTQCRTVDVSGQSYEAVPAHLIRQAACAVLQCC